MSTTLPTITRKALANGKAFRYDNATTGEVVTKRSARRYEFASAYRITERDSGRFETVKVERKRPSYTAEQIETWGRFYEVRNPIHESIPVNEQPIVVYLHARADLAAKGSPDANRITSFVRIPGVIAIEEI